MNDMPTHGSKPGGVQSKHLKPVYSTDDPQYKKLEAGRNRHNAAQTAAKKRRQAYTEQLAAMKVNQLETVQRQIEDDEFVLSPADMLLSMIKEQQMIVANEKLTEAHHLKERQLLLAMYKEYATLTGANAPTAQSVDITSDPIVVKSPEEIQAELLALTAGLKSVT